MFHNYSDTQVQFTIHTCSPGHGFESGKLCNTLQPLCDNIRLVPLLYLCRELCGVCIRIQAYIPTHTHTHTHTHTLTHTHTHTHTQLCSRNKQTLSCPPYSSSCQFHSSCSSSHQVTHIQRGGAVFTTQRSIPIFFLKLLKSSQGILQHAKA